MATAPTVLITGAARRLGRALALDFARAGWRVAAHYGVSAAEAEGVVAEIRGQGGHAQAFGCDLADARAVAALIPSVAKALGPVTCLVNNASLFVYDDIASLDVARWDAHQAVNLRSPVLLAQALAVQLPAGVVGNIETGRVEMEALVGASQNATGALQATQAGNQILALQSQQITDLTALLAAQGRAESLAAAAETAAQEQAREQRRRFLEPGDGYQPGNATMFRP